MQTRWVAIAALVALLQACTANGPRGDEAGSIEVAVSRQSAGTEDRHRAKVHTELGQLYLREGRFEVALDEARIALEADSGYAPAHNLRGLVFMDLRKNDLAEDSFRRALGIARNDPEINNDYGWFLCQSGRPQDSIAYFKVAIANPLHDAQAKSLVNAGLCSLRSKADREAEDYFLRAIRVDRRQITAHYWLADIAYRGGRFDDAQRRIRDFHTVNEPVAASAWLGLRIARKLGDREEEARLNGIIRRKFRDSPEYARMSRGEFD